MNLTNLECEVSPVAEELKVTRFRGSASAKIPRQSSRAGWHWQLADVAVHTGGPSQAVKVSVVLEDGSGDVSGPPLARKCFIMSQYNCFLKTFPRLNYRGEPQGINGKMREERGAEQLEQRDCDSLSLPVETL